jgi:hypothetical protein
VRKHPENRISSVVSTRMADVTPILSYETPVARPKRLGRTIVRAVIGLVGTMACAFGGILVARLWSDVRDSRAVVTSAVLILLLSTALRGWRRWGYTELLLALVLAECVAWSWITLATGLGPLNWYNLLWLQTVSLFIAPPWVAGLLIGELVLRRIERRRAGEIGRGT